MNTPVMPYGTEAHRYASLLISAAADGNDPNTVCADTQTIVYQEGTHGLSDTAMILRDFAEQKLPSVDLVRALAHEAADLIEQLFSELADTPPGAGAEFLRNHAQNMTSLTAIIDEDNQRDADD